MQNGIRNISDAVGNGFQTLDTRVCQQSYETSQLVNGINNNINAVTAAVNGGFAALNSTICQNAYENLGQFNTLNNTVQNGFNSANVVAMQNQNSLQSLISSCCCDQRAATADLKYTIASEDCNTRNLMQTIARDQMDNANANTRAILDKLTSQEIAAKDAQIAAQNQKLFAAELAASQSAQNAYLINTLRPTPVPAYPASSPCGYNWNPSVLAGYGFGNGNCGCGL